MAEELEGFKLVSVGEYMAGMRRKLTTEQLEEESIYLLRHTSEAAREAGGFALEMSVYIDYIEPIDDCHEMSFAVLDKDGELFFEDSTLITNSGLVSAPDVPVEEGYLLENPEFDPDSVLAGAKRKIISG